MEQNNLNVTCLDISSTEAARVLVDPKKRLYLDPFIETECSASQAATQLGVKLPAMLYQINRLVDLGLLKISKSLPRRGQAIKLYQATAQRFFVPFELSKAESLNTLLAELESNLQQFFFANLLSAGQDLAENWGISIYKNNEGIIAQDLVPHKHRFESSVPLLMDKNAPSIWSSTAFLDLDFVTAKALQHDLAELLSKYSLLQEEGKTTYLLKLGLTPLKE